MPAVCVPEIMSKGGHNNSIIQELPELLLDLPRYSDTKLWTQHESEQRTKHVKGG